MTSELIAQQCETSLVSYGILYRHWNFKLGAFRSIENVFNVMLGEIAEYKIGIVLWLQVYKILCVDKHG